jgi:CheY-like chemotaxis protein
MACMTVTTPTPTRITILVVDDEPITRMNTVLIIEEAGYDVIEACNAEEAIALLETRPEIRVVFSDIEMPGSIDGLKLLHAVRERWPPVILILASGRVSPRVEEMPPETAFLRKPYPDRDLLKVLADRQPPGT